MTNLGNLGKFDIISPQVDAVYIKQIRGGLNCVDVIFKNEKNEKVLHMVLHKSELKVLMGALELFNKRDKK